MVFGAPQVEQAAIAQGQAGARVHSQPGCGAIDPLRRALKLGVGADGSLIDDAVAFSVGPLAAPLLIAERGHQADRAKHLGQRFSVTHLGLGFDAVLVALIVVAGAGKALVSQNPAARIAADTKNFGAGAHLAIGSVVENIALESARGIEMESCSLEPAREAC